MVDATDYVLDAASLILRAAAARPLTDRDPDEQQRIVNTLREIMGRSYIAGVNSCHEAYIAQSVSCHGAERPKSAAGSPQGLTVGCIEMLCGTQYTNEELHDERETESDI